MNIAGQGPQMPRESIIRAWKDAAYASSGQGSLPKNPAGELESRELKQSRSDDFGTYGSSCGSYSADCGSYSATCGSYSADCGSYSATCGSYSSMCSTVNADCTAKVHCQRMMMG